MSTQLKTVAPSSTITIAAPAPTTALQIRGPELAQDPDRRVTWDATGIDNEHLNKKKSKSMPSEYRYKNIRYFFAACLFISQV